jgi:hypothetical protein
MLQKKVFDYFRYFILRITCNINAIPGLRVHNRERKAQTGKKNAISHHECSTELSKDIMKKSQQQQ